MRFACPPKKWQAERLPDSGDLVVFLFRSDRGRWLGAKFAVADFAAGICDVAARTQRDRSEQYYHDCQRYG